VLKFLSFFERKRFIESLGFLLEVNRACKEIRSVLQQEILVISVQSSKIKLKELLHFPLELVWLKDPSQLVVSAECQEIQWQEFVLLESQVVAPKRLRYFKNCDSFKFLNISRLLLRYFLGCLLLLLLLSLRG